MEPFSSMDSGAEPSRQTRSRRNTRLWQHRGRGSPLTQPLQDPEQALRDRRQDQEPQASQEPTDEGAPSDTPVGHPPQDSVAIADLPANWQNVFSTPSGQPSTSMPQQPGSEVDVDEVVGQETEARRTEQWTTEAKETFAREMHTWVGNELPRLVGSLVADLKVVTQEEMEREITQHIREVEVRELRPFVERTVRAALTSPEVVMAVTRQMLSDPETHREILACVQPKTKPLEPPPKPRGAPSLLSGLPSLSDLEVPAKKEESRAKKKKPHDLSGDSSSDKSQSDSYSSTSSSSDTEEIHDQKKGGDSSKLASKTVSGLKRIKPVNPLYKEALDYRTYRLLKTSTRYNHKIAGKIHKWQSRLKVQMEFKRFKPSDPISILGYLHAFKAACDALGIHEGAAMWLLKAYMEEPARSSLSMRLSHPKTGKAGKGKLTSYSSAVNYLLQTYASDDVIAEAEADLRHFTQTRNITPQEYAVALTLKVLRCGPVYTEARMIGIYIEGLQESIRSTVRTYWGEHPQADLNALARHATSVTNLTGSGKTRLGRPTLPIEEDSETPRGTPTPPSSSQQSSTPQPSLVLSDDSIFTNELLMLHSQGSKEADVSSSTLMDAGDYCRICYAFKAHPSSKCPYLKGKEGFVVARNKNFNAYIRRARPGGRPGRRTRRRQPGERKDDKNDGSEGQPVANSTGTDEPHKSEN